MAESITLEISEETLIEALRKLPPERRQQLFEQVNEVSTEKSKDEIVWVPAGSLRDLTGIISVGGDALLESEQIYDE